ncbi:Gfo/Idh/MocA family oxidoreductase [Terrimonas sp. NA20]|uniref:Gfo/Idh/MocA family oxidoreductase n=1 Tax=Terrimonas ginsenosidimutans TaxID=2908004 RepID=A0ABS9KR77_9BACT|nr:Gfo/Idh/MocA family oxidoreductase [Terrimonas ginsenosidimutans]MCG2614821.1 Gfo/Idh/MocA family oxidoreductase [Terrimonas ginsenosidimutans]
MMTNQTISYKPLPILVIGAGGIVTTSHLPAYGLAGYAVNGIYDLDPKKTESVAKEFAIPSVYASISEMVVAVREPVVFDVAVPAGAIPAILEQLPDNASVLIQKPMGDDLAMAKQILEITRRKKMNAAVNFQLRYAPYILEAKKMIAEGAIGELVDIEVNVNVYTPWHLWDFLFQSPRVEILYHSIHYIDLVRNLLGNPKTVYAKTVGHPAMKELASVRSAIILDYGQYERATILTNHCHQFGNNKQHSYIKLEGTAGAIRIGMGVLQNYPTGIPDSFEYISLKDKDPEWKNKTINGSWFPHAFAGSMEQVMLAANGKINQPDNSVEDAIHTMACVEAAYRSSDKGGEWPVIK